MATSQEKILMNQLRMESGKKEKQTKEKFSENHRENYHNSIKSNIFAVDSSVI